MGRLLKNALLGALTIALLLIVSRTAFAQAPFCDFRAATNIAPPPLLPVRDVRFEQDTAYLLLRFCQAVRGASASEGKDRSRPERLSSHDGSPGVDVGFLPGPPVLPRRGAARRVATTVTRTKGSSGFPPGVYRPPR